MTTQPRPQIGSAFWIVWVLANAVGMFGYAIGVVIVSRLYEWNLDASLILASATVGLALGFVQWLVLRHWGFNDARWIWASLLGWMAGTLIAKALGPYIGVGFTSTAEDIGISIITGALQMYVLRQWSSKAKWWILAYLIGRILSLEFGLFNVLTEGIIFGAITGLALIWLLRHPIQEFDQSTSSV
jgi:hypothetical protein